MENLRFVANKKFERIVLYVGRLLSEEANLSYIYLYVCTTNTASTISHKVRPYIFLQIELQMLTFGKNTY